ncbi:MAG: hypothetical protein U0P45_07635 [Acidimicrobiales bacterium]
MGRKFYVAFLPWMMFAFVARAGGQGAVWAAAAALLGALLVAQAEQRDGGASWFSRSSILLAAVLLATGLMAWGSGFDRWSRVAAALGLMAVTAIPIRGMPFVEHYARDLVPPALLGTERFRATNRAVAQTWVVAFAAMAASMGIAAAVDLPLVATVGNWIAPALVLVWCTERTTRQWQLEFGEEPDGGIVGLFEA